jgi:S-adenosylmethionine decarboxylase
LTSSTIQPNSAEATSAMTHGRHIKVLGWAPPARLRAKAQIAALLETLVGRLGMRCLGPVQVYEVEEQLVRLGVEPFEDEGGVSAIVVLSTSHCAIHTWPLREYFVMDVYSCRDFEADAIASALTAMLEARNLQLTDVSSALVPQRKPQGSAAQRVTSGEERNPWF